MSRRGPAIAAIVAAFVLVLVFIFLVLPKSKQVGQAERDLEEARDQEMALRAELERLQETREEAPRVERQLVKARRQVPPHADLPGLINLLQDAADVSAVDFFSISPGTPTAATGANAAQIPAQVQVIGGFFPVDEFLFRLETMPRAAKVISISVSPGPDGLPQINVTLQVSFYTTDLSAGPGQVPGGGAPPASPAPTPSPAASPGG